MMYPLLSQANRNLRHIWLTCVHRATGERQRETDALIHILFVPHFSVRLKFYFNICVWYVRLLWLLVYCTMYAHVFSARYVARIFLYFILTNSLLFIHFFICSHFFASFHWHHFHVDIFLWNSCSCMNIIMFTHSSHNGCHGTRARENVSFNPIWFYFGNHCCKKLIT